MRKEITTIVMYDDLTGEEGARQFEFLYGGRLVVVDLGGDNAAKFEQIQADGQAELDRIQEECRQQIGAANARMEADLEAFAQAGRIIRNGKVAGKVKATAVRVVPVSAAPKEAGPNYAEIRAHFAAKGRVLAALGRLSQAVVDEYNADMANPQPPLPMRVKPAKAAQVASSATRLKGTPTVKRDMLEQVTAYAASIGVDVEGLTVRKLTTELVDCASERSPAGFKAALAAALDA